MLDKPVPHRYRRTKAEIDQLKSVIYEEAEANKPVTDRQLFYRMGPTGRGVIRKEEVDYQNVVIRLAGDMRESGELPWEWITDSTRWMRKPRSYSSLEDAVQDAARTYRRDLWANQNVYIEIWCEKLALLGVLSEITDSWDTPLMITRGFTSKGFAHGAAQQIIRMNRPTYIYNVGDHDPSGIKIWEDVQKKIRRYAPDANIHFERLAVTPEQIEQYGLPTRPTKRNRNTHAQSFSGDSVEVDALPPNVLRQLVNNAIEQHVDQRQLAIIKEAEESEQHALAWFGKDKDMIAEAKSSAEDEEYELRAAQERAWLEQVDPNFEYHNRFCFTRDGIEVFSRTNLATGETSYIPVEEYRELLTGMEGE